MPVRKFTEKEIEELKSINAARDSDPAIHSNRPNYNIGQAVNGDTRYRLWGYKAFYDTVRKYCPNHVYMGTRRSWSTRFTYITGEIEQYLRYNQWPLEIRLSYI